MFAIAGLALMIGAFLVSLISTSPFVGLLGFQGSGLAWVAQNVQYFYVGGIFLIAYGLTRSFITSILITIIGGFAFIFMGWI